MRWKVPLKQSVFFDKAHRRRQKRFILKLALFSSVNEQWNTSIEAINNHYNARLRHNNTKRRRFYEEKNTILLCVIKFFTVSMSNVVLESKIVDANTSDDVS